MKGLKTKNHWRIKSLNGKIFLKNVANSFVKIRIKKKRVLKPIAADLIYKRNELKKLTRM